MLINAKVGKISGAFYWHIHWKIPGESGSGCYY